MWIAHSFLVHTYFLAHVPRASFAMLCLYPNPLRDEEDEQGKESENFARHIHHLDAVVNNLS